MKRTSYTPSFQLETIDWATGFNSAGYSDSRVRILVTADLPKVFLGSMLRNVLFSCGYNQRQEVWCYLLVGVSII